jgi:hypothetical protein
VSSYPRGVPVNLVERFYTIDPLTEIETLEDPTTVTFRVENPDDTVTSYIFGVDGNVTRLAQGVYLCKLAAPLPTGVYEYVAIGTGAVQVESPVRTFDVLPDTVSAPVVGVAPASGPCTPWIAPDEIDEFYPGSLGIGSDVWKLESVAAAASDLMFQVSGRVYNGLCERTIRPCASACGCFAVSRAVGLTWAWTSYPGGAWWTNECGDRCGCGSEDYLPLSGYPVREVLAVKIDGQVVDPSTYFLEEGRRLLRTNDGSWPACQNLTLDDSQPGTFSVRYRWGVEPPELGKMAAAQLAGELYKLATTGKCALPARATKVVRQGVSVDMNPAMTSLLRSGSSGLQLVDAFVAASNPAGVLRRPLVWSPDVRRPGRRVA